MLIKQNEPRRHGKTVEDIGKLNPRAYQPPVLLNELAGSTSNEFLLRPHTRLSIRAHVQSRETRKKKKEPTSRGMDLPTMRCIKSGTLLKISLALPLPTPSP